MWCVDSQRYWVSVSLERCNSLSFGKNLNLLPFFASNFTRTVLLGRQRSSHSFEWFLNPFRGISISFYPLSNKGVKCRCMRNTLCHQRIYSQINTSMYSWRSVCKWERLNTDPSSNASSKWNINTSKGTFCFLGITNPLFDNTNNDLSLVIIESQNNILVSF